MANLADAIIEEIERCNALIKEYEALGAVGQFGKAMIQQTINRAQRALASGDVLQILAAYEALKECE